IRQEAWTVREISGDECLLMRPIVINGTFMSPDVRSALDGLRAQGELTWAMLDNLMGSRAIPAQLVDAIGTARGAYSSANHDRDAIYAWLGQGGPVVALDDWNRQCFAPFVTILQIAQIAVDLLLRQAIARNRYAHGTHYMLV